MSQTFDAKGNVIHPPSDLELRSWPEDYEHENGNPAAH